MHPHTAATAIAQRFWYAKVRWLTRARMGRIVMHRHGLDYARLRRAPMSMDQFMKLIVFSALPNAFAKWMHSVIRISRREADELDDDTLRLATGDPGNAVNRALSAYLFTLYGRDALDVSLPHAEALDRSARRLCECVHECMAAHTTGGDACPRTLGRRVVEALDAFLGLHREWLAHNSQTILQRLAAGAIMRMHDLIGMHGGAASQPSNLPLGVFAVRSMAVTGETEPIRRVLFDSSAVRMMRRMARSEFWGAHGLHTLRFAHELLVDPEYRVAMEQTVPLLSRKYAPHRHVWSADELLLDAGTVLMWGCHRAEDISELAEAVDLDLFPERLHDIPGTVERICGVIARLMPPAPVVYGGVVVAEGVHHGSGGAERTTMMMGTRASLERLLHATLTLRNALANAEVDELRAAGDNVVNLHHANTLMATSGSTRRWVLEAVLRHVRAGTADAERLARGDPFELLKLHDRAIIDTVLLGPVGGATVLHHRGNADALPDVLHFDLERIHRIRQTLVHRKGWGARAAARFHELVTSGECLDHPPPDADVLEAAATLRTVVHICRCKHGNRIAELAQHAAQDLIAH